MNFLLFSLELTSPISSWTKYLGLIIFKIASLGSLGNLRLLAKSLLEPVGIYPKITFSKCMIPPTTSLIVPSPPNTTSLIFSLPLVSS